MRAPACMPLCEHLENRNWKFFNMMRDRKLLKAGKKGQNHSMGPSIPMLRVAETEKEGNVPKRKDTSLRQRRPLCVPRLGCQNGMEGGP